MSTKITIPQQIETIHNRANNAEKSGGDNWNNLIRILSSDPAVTERAYEQMRGHRTITVPPDQQAAHIRTHYEKALTGKGYPDLLHEAEVKQLYTYLTLSPDKRPAFLTTVESDEFKNSLASVRAIQKVTDNVSAQVAIDYILIAMKSHPEGASNAPKIMSLLEKHTSVQTNKDSEYPKALNELALSIEHGGLEKLVQLNHKVTSEEVSNYANSIENYQTRQPETSELAQ